jgi:hypothetical protein
VTICTLVFGAPTVQADTPQLIDGTHNATSTVNRINDITASMEARGVPSVEAIEGETKRVTYILPSGSTVVVMKPIGGGGDVTPQISISAGWGLYIYLSRNDQIVLAAGGAAGLAVLICGSTVLIGCAAATAALTGAAAWIATRGGICPTSAPRLEIRILGYTRYKCVR